MLTSYGLEVDAKVCLQCDPQRLSLDNHVNKLDKT